MLEQLPANKKLNVIETMVPVQRKYLDRLIMELEEISGGRGKEEIFSSRDLNLIKRYVEKILEISLFLKEKRANSVEKEIYLLKEWAKEFFPALDTDNWIFQNFNFTEWPRIVVSNTVSVQEEGVNYNWYVADYKNVLNLLLTPDINYLPEGLEMNELWITGNKKLFHLPNKIKVRRRLLVSLSEIKYLPEDLEVEILEAILCQSLFYLPQKIKVKILIIQRSAVKELPENLALKFLDVSNCENLIDLPVDISVDKLIITGCQETVKQKARLLKDRGQIGRIIE